LHSNLVINIVSGEHLLSADLNGKSDPYVKVEIKNPDSYKKSKQKARTHVVDKTLNPTWNFKTKFNLRPNGHEACDGVLFKAKDWDRFSDSDPLGDVVLPWEEILGNYSGSGWKKHKLVLKEPKKRDNPGVLNVETQVTSQILRYLAYLKKNPGSEMSERAAQSLAEGFPYGPRKLVASQLAVWIVTNFMAEKCYRSDQSKLWKACALRILSQCHPLDVEFLATSNFSEDQRNILLEAHLLWVRETHTQEPLEESVLQQHSDQAWNFFKQEDYIRTMYHASYPAVAERQEEYLIAVCYEKLFPDFPQFATRWWVLAAYHEQPDAVEKVKSWFVEEMKLAQAAIKQINDASDLDKVSVHLRKAVWFSFDAGVKLMSSVFFPEDQGVEENLKRAASAGCDDATKLLELYQQHETWTEVQQKCPEYRRVLRHISNLVSSTPDWNSFKYINIL